MMFRKTMLVGLGVVEVVLLAYSAALIIRSFNQQELLWGGFTSFDMPVLPLLFALIIGVCFVLVLNGPENSN